MRDVFRPMGDFLPHVRIIRREREKGKFFFCILTLAKRKQMRYIGVRYGQITANGGYER